jgi:nucleotide-binding universal stress UspA family protein
MHGSGQIPGPAPAQAVVVGVDGSRTADRALGWAAQYALVVNKPLLITHAVPAIEPDVTGWGSDGGSFVRVDEQLLADGEALVAAAAKQVAESHPDLDVSTVVEQTDPRQLLLRLAEVAAVVVTGSRGRGQFRSLLLGSVTAGVAGRAGCPVVVIPADPENDKAVQ